MSVDINVNNRTIIQDNNRKPVGTKQAIDLRVLCTCTLPRPLLPPPNHCSQGNPSWDSR